MSRKATQSADEYTSGTGISCRTIRQNRQSSAISQAPSSIVDVAATRRRPRCPAVSKRSVVDARRTGTPTPRDQIVALVRLEPALRPKQYHRIRAICKRATTDASGSPAASSKSGRPSACSAMIRRRAVGENRRKPGAARLLERARPFAHGPSPRMPRPRRAARRWPTAEIERPATWRCPSSVAFSASHSMRSRSPTGTRK